MPRTQRGNGSEISTILLYQANLKMMAILLKTGRLSESLLMEGEIYRPFLTNKSRKSYFKLICVIYKKPHPPGLHFSSQVKKTDINQ